MMTNINTGKTQDSSSTAVGADTPIEEMRQRTAAEEKNIEEYIETMSNLIKAMIKTTLYQKNINMTIKEGLPKLQEALNSLIESQRSTATAHRSLKGRKNRRADEVISPESQMTPAGKKPKELLRPKVEEKPPGTPLFRFPDDNTWQEIVPSSTKERKKESEQSEKSSSNSNQTSRRQNLRERAAEDQGICGPIHNPDLVQNY